MTQSMNARTHPEAVLSEPRVGPAYQAYQILHGVQEMNITRNIKMTDILAESPDAT
jgi:hypothetical protein